MSENSGIAAVDIQYQIYTIHDMQVMIDEDLAFLYGVETKRLNEQVKRNLNRFPAEFMFQLSEDDMENLKSQFATSRINSLRSQNVTLKNRRGQHRKYLPYVFTEQGVAMLSAVLRSDTAINVSIQIINAFVAMRRFLRDNAQVFNRLNALEFKQAETDKKVERVLNAIEDSSIPPKQGIFFDGQIFDAWKFVSDLIRSANKSLVLIDNYKDDTVLQLFAKRKQGVAAILLTKSISSQMKADIDKFNKQYEPMQIKEFLYSHDRFLIIDDKNIYHIGASLKDLGKKWFAFARIESGAMLMLKKLELL
jgi:hypothetical protein